MTTAQAEAEALQRIAASLPEGQAAMYLLGQKYLESLPALTAGKGSTVFLPVEAAGVMGALGSLREVLKASGGGTVPETRGALGAGPIDLKKTDRE